MKNPVNRYGMLSLNNGRGYLIPLDHRKATVRALDLYNAQTFKAKLAKEILVRGLRTGVVQPFLRKVCLNRAVDNLYEGVLDESLLNQLKNIFSEPDLRFAVSLGTPGPHRKPVLQALAQDGTILGYVKVGLNRMTNPLAQNEAIALKRLEHAQLKSCSVPKLLYAGWWKNSFLCIQSAPKDKSESSPPILMRDHLDIQRELATVRLRWMPLATSLFWVNLLQRIEDTPNSIYTGLLKLRVQEIEVCLSSELLPFHLSHGDFAPWNMRLQDGRLYLYDWEYSVPESPPGYDLFHFTMETARLLARCSPEQIYRSFQRGETAGQWITEHLESLGVSAWYLKPLLLLYILDKISFFALEAEFNEKLLQYLMNLSNLLSLRE